MASAVPTPPNVPRTSYQGNSKAAAANAAEATEPEEDATPRMKKIDGVKVTKVKKPLGQRIAENFGGDNLQTVGKVLLVTVLLPSAKDLMMEMVEVGTRRLIYGESSRRSGSGVVGSASRRPTGYSSISTQGRLVGSAERNEPAMTSRERQMFDFSGLLIEDLGKAEEIIMEMEAAIDEFGWVTVGDFYEAIGESGNGFTDRKFGWDSHAFDGATPKRVRGGWVLDIPAPVGLK
jgi:hypothetical protein